LLQKKEKFLLSAQKNLQKGQVAKAIKDYQKVLEFDPKDIRSRQRLAELYTRAGMQDEAYSAFDLVAQHYTGNGFFLKAIAVYKQMQKIAPGQLVVYRHLATLNEKQGLLGNALTEYRRLADLLEKEGKVPEFLDVLERMKALDGQNSNLRLRICEGCLRQGLQERGRQEILDALAVMESNRDLPAAHKIQSLLEAYHLSDTGLLLALGKTLLAADGEEQAKAVLSGLAAADPGQTQVLALLAQAHGARQDYAAEKDCFRQLLAQEGENPEWQLGFARAGLQEGTFDEILGYLETWRDSLLRAGKGADLKFLYEALNKALPGNQLIQASLREIYEHTGEGAKLFELISDGDAGHADTVGALAEESGAEEFNHLVDFGAAPGPVVRPEAADDPAETWLGPTDFDEFPSEGIRDEDFAGPADGMERGGAATAGPASNDFEMEIELDLDGEQDATATPYRDELADLERELGAVLENDLLDLDGDSRGGFDLVSELEEAEFYLQQGFLDDAERKCGEILNRQPGFQAALDLLAGVRNRKQQAAPPKAAGTRPAQTAPAGTGVNLAGLGDKERSRLDGSLSAFKKGLADAVAPDDIESHFNLGIAYKEMGLLDEAIEEFDKSMADPSRHIDALTLKSLCLAARGNFAGAADLFRQGLDHDRLKDQERLNLYFELGLLYVAWGRPLDALDSFQRVADVDPFFREASDQVRQLRRQLGLDGDEPGGSGQGPGQSRVTFL
jgi:tetratricopeptide (TPR) repeat protein